MVKLAPGPTKTAIAPPLQPDDGLRILGLSASTFESLRIRDYRWLWLSSLTSFTAMSMQMFARIWLVRSLGSGSLIWGIPA